MKDLQDDTALQNTQVIISASIYWSQIDKEQTPFPQGATERKHRKEHGLKVIDKKPKHPGSQALCPDPNWFRKASTVVFYTWASSFLDWFQLLLQNSN